VAALDGPRRFGGVFRTDDDARAVYAEAAGIQQIWPIAVAVARSADDVVSLVHWARQRGVSLVPRGSGTSMAGGAIGAGVITDLGRLRDMGPVDLPKHRIMVGPGVRRGEVERAAGACGLRFPVDPSSGDYCTVGGMAATNAAGAHTLKYGAMRQWVVALDCVFADGSRALIRRGEPPPTNIAAIARFLRDVAPAVRAADPRSLRHADVRKESSGYALAEYAAHGDLLDLLVGSEGTLALIVGLELALCPRPVATASLLAAFPSLDAAVAGATATRAAGASACELLDRTFLDLIRDASETAVAPDGTEAVLLIEMEDQSATSVAADTRRLAATLQDGGATQVALALDEASEAALWHIRHAASPALAKLDPALKSMQFIEDGAVPPQRLADYVRGVRAALARCGVRGAIFGHAGDGHVHVNPLIDVRGARWREQVTELLASVTTLTGRLGGTLAGEHGDGRLRAPLLGTVWGGADSPALQLFAAVKAAFDPENLLNPGVKVPTGDRTIGAIKYDPALPPLPVAARHALDRVADGRAYAVPRLDLLAL
jgi:FAD/FMN-containing dehydrogenase